MQFAFRTRPVSVAISSLLLLQLLSFGLPISSAHASAVHGHLILKQIDWAGTVANPNDQWVELYNPTEQVVDLAEDPYTLTVGGKSEVTLNTGAVTPMQSVLISRLDPTNPTAHSSLTASLPTRVTPQLVLPIRNAQYVLSNSTGTAKDLANLEVGAPFAGSMTASEQRLINALGQYQAGDQASAWLSTKTIGRNVASGVEKYATPAENAVAVLAAPTNVVINAGQSNRPTVLAHFPTPSTYGIVRFTNTSTGEVVQGVGDTVSGFQPAIPLQSGSYSVTVATSNAPDGDRSAAVQLPFSSTMSSGMPSPTVPAVQPPTLDLFVTQTNKSTITLTGMVQPGTVSVSVIANGSTVVQALNGMLNFSLTLPLRSNANTDIQLVAISADGNKSQPTTVQVLQSTVVPNVPASDHLTVQSNPAGSADTLTGHAGAVQSGSKISVYADVAMTNLIGQAMAAVDGSFPVISLGDNRYTSAYIVQTDAAGNTSLPLLVTNPINIADQNLNLPTQLLSISATAVSLQLLPMNGVSQYLIKYRTLAGQYGSPVMVCATLSQGCSLNKHLTGLQPGTNYIVAVAAVDGQGRMSNYTETSFQTAQNPVVKVVTVAAPTVITPSAPNQAPATTNLPAPTPVARPAVTAQPTATMSATMSPSPTSASASDSPSETGAVKSATTTARNWTPWIVLAVLIGLAILATAGYFYWFGGEAGAAMDAAATPVKPTSPTDASVNKNEADRPTKRW